MDTIGSIQGYPGSTQRILLDYVEFHDTGGTTTPAQCADAADNDGDGLIDLNDPGC
jgi:hypothetical protein